MSHKGNVFLIINTFRTYKWKLMLCMAIVTLGLGCRFYISSFQASTIWFAYNYERASKGLNPNGSRFNAYEIKSEAVLERALELAGVTEISPEELGENITIQVPVKSGRDYIATQYKVTYIANKELKSVDAQSMLQMVAYAYLEYFYDNYTDNTSILQYRPADTEGLEYRQIARYYNTKLIQLKNYVNGRIEENKSFVSDGGITFQDIRAKVDNLLRINLSNFRSFVTEKGLYKERRSYVELLDYKNYKDDNIYSLNTKTYNLYKRCIEQYDPKLTGVVLVPSVDRNQDFYMSKTKTGIDHLAENAVGAEETAEKKRADIKNRQSIIDHIKESDNQASDLKKADEMIWKIDAELKNVSNQAMQIDVEYSRYKNKDYVTVKDNPLGLMTRMNFTKAVLLSAVFTAMAATAVMYRENKRSTREDGQ